MQCCRFKKIITKLAHANLTPIKKEGLKNLSNVLQKQPKIQKIQAFKIKNDSISRHFYRANLCRLSQKVSAHILCQANFRHIFLHFRPLF